MDPVVKSLHACFSEYAAACGDRPFLSDSTRSYTVREGYAEAVSLANALYDGGVRGGFSVALRCERSLECCLLFYALRFLGAVAVLCDPHTEAEQFLAASGTGIAADGYLAREIDTWVLKTGEKRREIAFLHAREEARFPMEEGLFRPAVVIFTSGSSGRSKAVMLSEYGIINHCRNDLFSGARREGEFGLVVLPLHHAFGVSCITAAVVAHGSLFFPAKTDCETVLSDIETRRITHLEGVPSLYHALAWSNHLLKRDTSSLVTGMVGGAPVTKEQFEEIEAGLGVRLIAGYGMSEYIGITTGRYEDPLEIRAASVGKFEPMNRGYILGEDGEELPPMQVGEICVAGPSMMLGYFGDEEGTRAAVDERGRLHTGDLGYVDEAGYVFVTGRKKDIIIRNGNNLSARKIEEALLSVEGISDAAVVALTHPVYGEVPAALVVSHADMPPTEEVILQKLKAILPKNELPVRFLFAEEMPLTPSGKTDKGRVKELFS